jgi:glutamate-5-semialdehyde dehydrogenase
VLVAHGLPPESITLITTADRDELRGLLALSGLIDLVIPRGGEGLIAFVAEHSRIPIVKHDRGVCHVYVDADADLNMAIEIIVNGKTSAPATCNTTECVLIHEAVAPALVPKLADRLHAEGVTIHADERFRGMAHTANTVPATEGDWGREYLALALAVRVVADLGIAIEHIARYTSNHTEAIITENHAVAERFLGAVQSSCVLVNASTRFNDGYQLGLGAEIGISTSKIHAYGPMGLEGLTAERYIVRGSGQIR